MSGRVPRKAAQGKEARTGSETSPVSSPPPLPRGCDLPSDRVTFSCAPPVVLAESASEEKRQAFKTSGSELTVAERLRNRRERGRVQSTSWLSSIAVHVVVILLLAAILAPVDFGGIGLHAITLQLDSQRELEPLTVFESNAIEAAGTDDSSDGLSEDSPLASLLDGIGTRTNTSTNSTPPVRPDSASGSFFGIEVSGHEFVYVLDMSNSMRGRRFDRAIGELIRSIEELGPNQRFYVLLFSTQTLQMFGASDYTPKSVAATVENKLLLAEWLRTAYDGGGTDPREALNVAMRMNPNAVFMLSDGEFNGKKNQKMKKLFGPNSDAFSIVAAAPNRPPIHAIAFEDRVSQENMKRLASMTDGQFRFVDQEDGTELEELLSRIRLAKQYGDRASASLFLREAVSNVDNGKGAVDGSKIAELSSLLVEFAEEKPGSGTNNNVRSALNELIRMDPMAEWTKDVQSALVGELVSKVHNESDPRARSAMESELSSFVRTNRGSWAVKKVSEPIVRKELDFARRLYDQGDTLKSVSKLNAVIADFPHSELTEDCRAELERLGEEMIAEAEQLTDQEDHAASARLLLSIKSALSGTQLQRNVTRMLEKEARQMLVAYRDANLSRDLEERKRVQQQLRDVFAEDPVLEDVRKELSMQERQARAAFQYAFRLEQASGFSIARQKYQAIAKDYPETLVARQAKERIRILSQFR